MIVDDRNWHVGWVLRCVEDSVCGREMKRETNVLLLAQAFTCQY